MAYNIGLIDYDVLCKKKYRYPNYDLGVMYAYYKQDVNNNVRLVSSLSYGNLSQYDKICVFKQSKYISHPSSVVEKYYSLPIEEYGPGFLDKPIRPLILETREIEPDFSCYNNMILFSLEHPKHKLAWKLHRRARGKKYKPLRMYEDYDNETLKKDFPMGKYCMVYDDPTDLLNNKEKWVYLNSLLDKKIHLDFAQSLDISRLNDTNIIEQVLSNKKYTSLRRYLVVTDINVNVDWLVNFMMSKYNGQTLKVSVHIPDNYTPMQCLETMLLINYYNHKTNFNLYMVPTLNKLILKDNDLALSAFNYLKGKPHYMSFYEYMFNIAYLAIGVPKTLIHTGEQQYEYIFQNYGLAPQLKYLEQFMDTNPHLRESILIGGSSNYEEQRRKYYVNRGSAYAFRTSSYDAS